MATPSEVLATSPNPAPAMDMQSRIEAGLSSLGFTDDAVFDGSKVNESIAFTDPAPAPVVTVDANGKPHGADGQFVQQTLADSATDSATVQPEPSTPAVPAPSTVAKTATVAIGDLGEIPVNEVPKVVEALIEFERSKIQPEYEQTRAQYAAAQQQIADLQRQVAEANQIAETIQTWAKTDPDSFLATINSQAMAGQPQAQPFLRQPAAQPQGNYLTREQAEQLWAAKQAEQQSIQQAQQFHQARLDEVTKAMNEVLAQTFPKSEFPDDAVREEIYNAFSARVAAAPTGSFPKNLPIPILARKIATIAQTVKTNIGKHFASKVVAQAAVNAKAAPTPVGGGTMIPKRETLGPDAYRGSNLAGRIAQRLSHLQG